jgi:hypothetical protein
VASDSTLIIIAAIGATIAAIPGTIAAIASLRNGNKIVEVKHELNSRLTESIRLAAEVGYNKGVADEKQRTGQ